MLSNYPDGLTDHTPGCPWSEPEIPERDFDVTCSQSLSRTATVCTNNYIPGASGVDYEYDGDGGYTACDWHDEDDTSDTHWSEEYLENGYTTPIELIEMLRDYLQKDLDRVDIIAEEQNENKQFLERRLKFLIGECESWTVDETDFERD